MDQILHRLVVYQPFKANGTQHLELSLGIRGFIFWFIYLFVSITFLRQEDHAHLLTITRWTCIGMY